MLRIAPALQSLTLCVLALALGIRCRSGGMIRNFEPGDERGQPYEGQHVRPYLAPLPYRGKPNEPRFVPAVGAALAAAVGRPVEEIAAVTRANAALVFGLPEGPVTPA